MALDEATPQGATLSRVTVGGVEAVVPWGLAVETPVEIRLNGKPWTVMLATPMDLEDLAVGLALTECVIPFAGAVEHVERTTWQGEVSMNLTVPAELLGNLGQQSRSLVGNSGCGLCGTESLLNLHARREDTVGIRVEREPVSDQAILNAFAALPRLQPINQTTRSVHAAGWCNLDGTVALVREDVGRHNALDKLVGAMARGGMLDQVGFIVMTSRCSYELVSKATRTRASVLATISAPTTLALTWASTLHLPVVCLGPDRLVVRFGEEAAHAAR